MYKYDPKSLKAEEFINDEEIQATLAYADENKDNLELVDQILPVNVPRMDNAVTIHKLFQHLGSEQPMCVRNYSGFCCHTLPPRTISLLQAAAGLGRNLALCLLRHRTSASLMLKIL